jgi:hypothetical protein
MLVNGCSSNSGKIEGTRWNSQVATLKGLHAPKGIVQLIFNRNGSFVYVVGPKTFKGSYSLGIGDTVTLHMEQDFPGRKDHSEMVTVGGSVLTMTDSDGTAIAFDKEY